MRVSRSGPGEAMTANPALRWLRANLFNSVGNALTTLVILYLLYLTVGPFLRWAIFDAVFHADSMRSCHAAGSGACWAFIGEKWRFILFGRYPYDQQWRCALVAIILGALVGTSFAPSMWRKELI